MKTLLIISLVSFLSINAHAQLKNTKWKGTIQTDNKLNVVFDYKIDTVKVTNADDGSNIETMTYTVKNHVMTLKKVYGQSDCDATSTAQYKFQITGDVLHLTQVNDSCSDRISALKDSNWTRTK